ncbi:MAG TPA: 2-amino-4-hydroxy-6-hydroxymethyldihydropteridine diphosphokinase [Lysobacter sp.]
MRWLLLLGAEARYPDTLEAARIALSTFGELQPLTGERLMTDAAGSGRAYRNQLVSLAHDAPRAALVEACKRIERELGRGTLDGVPLDIDVLACADGRAWRPDPHATAKGEFDAVHVRVLLDEAGLMFPRNA